MTCPSLRRRAGLTLERQPSLFRIGTRQGANAYPYDVSLDAQRLLTLVQASGARGDASLNVLSNWQAGLRKQ